MAIKVKHDMNAAPAAAAGAASGRARRSMETARLFASGGGSGGRGGTQGATAHPVAPMGAHAQLTHASAPAVSAHAPAYRDTIDDRLRLQDEQNHAALERQELGEDAALKRLEASQEFTEGQNRRREEFSTAERIAKDEAARKEWDRQHGILRQERDADLIAAGTHEYGYSPEVQREYDKLMSEYNQGLREGRFKEGTPDGDQFKADLDRNIAALPKTLVQRKDPEGLARNRLWFRPDGSIIDPERGALVKDPADDERRRMEFQQKQIEMQMRRMDMLRQRMDRYELDMQKTYEERDPQDVRSLTQERFRDELDQMERQLAQMQAGLYGQTPTVAQPAPSAQPPAASALAAQPAPSAQPAQTQAEHGVKPLPQVFTPEQAADYKSQFKRR